MKIGYMSDLHLEFRDYPEFKNVEGGDVLILAGDITTAHTVLAHRNDSEYTNFKRHHAPKFKKDVLDKFTHVVYVMGNHEHYRGCFTDTANDLEKGFKAVGWEKIKLFDNEFHLIDGVLFIGSTLWTDFENENQDSMYKCAYHMNDYRIIYDKNSRAITPFYTLQKHKESLKFIGDTLKNASKKTPAVVFTHMAPALKSLNKEHVHNGLDGAYASNLEPFIKEHKNIKFWIHGHTHMNVDYMIGKTNVLANQRGYAHETSYRNFKGIKYFEVESVKDKN